VRNAVESTGTTWADKVKGIKDTTADKLHDAKDAASVKLHDAGEGLASTYQAGKEKLTGEPDFGNFRHETEKDPMHVPASLHYTTEQHTEQPKPSEGITESIKNTAVNAATKVSETAGAAKDTVVEKAHSLSEGIANVGHSAYDTTTSAIWAAKDKVVDTATKAKEVVVGAPERKGSVPDASADVPPSDKLLEGSLPVKEDRQFEKLQEDAQRPRQGYGAWL